MELSSVVTHAKTVILLETFSFRLNNVAYYVKTHILTFFFRSGISVVASMG